MKAKLLLLSILFLVLVMGMTNAVTDDDILDYAVTYLPFENLTDTGLYPSNLTNIGTSHSASCKIGGCQYWDETQSDYMLINNNNDVSNVQDWSVSTWIKPNDASTAADYNALYISTNGSTAKFLKFYYGGFGSDTITLITTDTNPSELSSNLAVNDAIGWSLLTIVYNNSDDAIMFYQNATYKGSHQLTAGKELYKGAINLGSHAVIGRHISSAVHYYDGYIDELLVINKSLSPAEITYLWNNGIGRALITGSNPPVITQINYTSDNGAICSYPTVCANSSDLTPTFKIDIGEVAQCKMSQTDQNYTLMTNACESGAWSNNLTCTWPTASKIGAPKLFYFACNDTSGNYNTAPLGNARTASLNLYKVAHGIVYNNGTIQPNVNVTALKQPSQTVYGLTVTNSTGFWDMSIYDSANYTFDFRHTSNVSLGGASKPWIAIE